MEAPENIYIDDPTGEFNDHWSVYQNDDSVEYTRTDAFIEKAVKWLMDNIQDYTDDGMGEHSFVLVHDLKEHFKKYMKGE
jgi:hypothetical protein